MAEIEPPSFSLGLDLDSPNLELRSQPPNTPIRSSHQPEGDDGEFELKVLDSDIDENPAAARLKRRRRGTSAAKFVCPSNIQVSEKLPDSKNDDDIEEFSSEEDRIRVREAEQATTVQHSVFSSSKVSLSGNRILTRQLPNQTLRKTTKRESESPASMSLHGMRNKVMVAEPFISPLRRFWLIDCDSDGQDKSEIGKEASKNNSLKQREPSHSCCASTSKRSEPSVLFPRKGNLRESFCQDKAFDVPTPALDELCAEYYKRIKDKDDAGPSFIKGEGSNQKVDNSKKMSQEVAPENALPPAHQYFFHEDLRTQRLIHSRLPHFFPLSASNNAGNKQQQDVSFIDYMGQFSHGEKQGGMHANIDQPSRKGRKKSSKSNLEEIPEASAGWVNPKHQERMTKDGGKRRVSAKVQSAGRWYTVNGMRVYYSGDGKELTGSSAYRHYKKESGKGLKKPKKKCATKRKK